ncbi:MAG: hypothetical protein AMK72_11885 [Planctomycetes bacterium SM23_25]|nr:MAG: hypothetical protein AMS14_00605 [Planctomycetes bacterium DG_20]KPK44604.1 MAG: hypothetical protein AMK72_11885 [Planctomycetes bacterium SM23_25]
MEDSVRQLDSEPVGRFAFSVAAAAPSPETAARWAERSERLAALLLKAWEDEQAAPTSGRSLPVGGPGRACG